MGFGSSGNVYDTEAKQKDLLNQRRNGVTKFRHWDDMSEGERAQYTARGYDKARYDSEAEANIKKRTEADAKATMGDDYIEPGQTRSKNMGPVAPDATDEALRKRRSSALLRAGAGMGRRSTFMTGEASSPMVGKTMLGGY